METVQKSGAYDVCASLFSPHRYEDHSNFPVLIMEDSSLDQQIVASVKAAAEDYIYDNDPEAIDFESSKDYTEEEIQKFGKENDWAFQVRYFLEHPSTMRMVKELTELMNSKNTRTNENDSSAQKKTQRKRDQPDPPCNKDKVVQAYPKLNCRLVRVKTMGLWR